MADADDASPKPRRAGQTVCDEPGMKDKFCAGHLKDFGLAPKELRARVPEGHILFRCQRCGRIYEGEPIRHLR